MQQPKGKGRAKLLRAFDPEQGIGVAKTFTPAVVLIDTNVLVYRYDARDGRKQQLAQEVLSRGIQSGNLRLPYQALIEFVSATTRLGKTGPLLERADALREVEELLSSFEVLYPTDGLLRLAVRGTSAYQLNWFDANLWAYAEFFGIPTLLSEDFQHNRLYGSVRVVNPFLEA